MNLKAFTSKLFFSRKRKKYRIVAIALLLLATASVLIIRATVRFPFVPGREVMVYSDADKLPEMFCEVNSLGCMKTPFFYNPDVLVVRFRYMTVKWCIVHCSSNFKTFAGLRNSQTCICAKDISHFADYQHQHSGCDQPCVGNKTELCGGTTSVRVYRLVGQCVQGPFSKKYVASRSLGCFWQHLWNNLGFPAFTRSSPEECLLVCEREEYPVANFDSSNHRCFCGRMTESFDHAHKVRSCLAKNSVEVFRTTAQDSRCEEVHLLPPRASNRTLLAAHPGSGGIRLRFLLERATGYYTGSSRHDQKLFRSGFLGEMLPLDDQRTDVIDDPLFYNRETYYDTIILLVRSPFDAMLAEFARCGLKDSKRAYTKKEELQAGFSDYFKRNADNWMAIIEEVLRSGKPYLVVYFDDLIEKPIETTRKVVSFLANKLLRPADFAQRLACLGQQVGTLASPKPSLGFLAVPYDDPMVEKVKRHIRAARRLLKDAGVRKPLPPYEKVFEK